MAFLDQSCMNRGSWHSESQIISNDLGNIGFSCIRASQDLDETPGVQLSISTYLPKTNSTRRPF